MMDCPAKRLPPARPEGYGVHYDYGGWRRPRRIVFSVHRGGLLRLYRHALRRYGRRDGWTEDIEAEVAAGSYSADFDIVGSEDLKQFVADLQEMGLRDLAISVDAFAWQPDIAEAEAVHEAELEAMTSLV